MAVPSLIEHARAGSAGDARFYVRSGPFTLAEVTHAARGKSTAGERSLAGVAPLHACGRGDVGFINSRRYLAALAGTKAGAVIVSTALADHVPAGCAAILCPAPDEAWALVAALFHPIPPSNPGIHPSAAVSPGAVVHATAEIGPFALVEDGAEIGARCRVGAYSSIARGVVMGADCRIGAHVTLSNALLGDRVCLFPGVRIGQEGFGFCVTKTGFLSAPQLGRVVVGDDVEVGANTTIDRGSVQDTVIGAGTRIDNLVQIGHNVRLGRCCVIVAQVGIAGSTVLEDFVQVGGQAALAQHLTVGTGAQIGAQAGLIADAPPGAILLGSPAQPRKDFFRQVAVLRRLARKQHD